MRWSEIEWTKHPFVLHQARVKVEVYTLYNY